jgi:hypothetical protein
MHLVKDINFLQYVIIDHSHKTNYNEVLSQKEEPIKLSNNSKAFEKLEMFLDQDKPDKFDLSDLDDQGKDEFLGMLYELLKCGVIEYETTEVSGKLEKHYFLNCLGDESFAF